MGSGQHRRLCCRRLKTDPTAGHHYSGGVRATRISNLEAVRYPLLPTFNKTRAMHMCHFRSTNLGTEDIQKYWSKSRRLEGSYTTVERPDIIGCHLGRRETIENKHEVLVTRILSYGNLFVTKHLKHSVENRGSATTMFE